MIGRIALEPAERGAWLALAEVAPEATFFHTPYWSDIAGAGGEWRDASLAGRLPDGARVVYPLVATPRGRFPRLAAGRSTFAGCYGGPIGERPLTPAERGALHREVARRHPAELHVTLVPGDASPAPPGFQRRSDSTHFIDLSDGFDAALARFHSGQRRAFRRGGEAGLTARAAATPEDHAAYEALYERTLALRGDASTSTYPPGVLRRMAALALEHPALVMLWLVEHDGELAMGAYGLRWRDHVAMWHAATAGLRLPMASPLVTLLGEMMQAVEHEGVTRFDLNPSGGLPGVEDFKRRLGAEEVPVVRLSRRTRGGQAALRAVNRVHRISGRA